MPGVLRPYTLTDVLSTLNNQGGQGQQDASLALTTPLSEVAEADEQITAADTAFGSVQTAPGWDQGVWGAGTWG